MYSCDTSASPAAQVASILPSVIQGADYYQHTLPIIRASDMKDLVFNRFCLAGTCQQSWCALHLFIKQCQSALSTDILSLPENHMAIILLVFCKTLKTDLDLDVRQMGLLGHVCYFYFLFVFVPRCYLLVLVVFMLLFVNCPRSWSLVVPKLN